MLNAISARKGGKAHPVPVALSEFATGDNIDRYNLSAYSWEGDLVTHGEVGCGGDDYGGDVCGA